MPASHRGAPMHVFEGRAAEWVVAAEIAVIYILSTIPTPLYAIYQRQFHFSHIVLTLIYAAYVVGTVVAMFFFGRLSDQIGRRPVVQISLGIAGASAVLFLITANTAMLFPARILSGLAIALASGASTAWILELEPHHDKAAATQLAIGSNLAGLGLGALLTGLLAEYAVWPLRLVYVLFLALLAPVAVTVAMTRKTVRSPKPLGEASLRPRLGVPKNLRARFIGPAIAAFVTFSVLGFYSALIPSLLTRVLHLESSAVAGGIVGGLFLIGLLAVAAAGTLQSRTGLLVSLGLLLPGVGLLIAAEALRSLAVLIIGTLITGVATGLGYQFSLRGVNDIAPQDKRAEMVSTYLIACYCGISLPVVGIGFLSKAASPWIADLTFAIVTAVLTILALGFEVSVSPAGEPERGG